MHHRISNNKKGANILRSILPQLPLTVPCTILCDSGRDMSVGIAIILLCLNFDLDWKRTTEPPKITKTLIKQHLSKVSHVCKANPSRSTLQSVNTYLFSLLTNGCTNPSNLSAHIVSYTSLFRSQQIRSKFFFQYFF